MSNLTCNPSTSYFSTPEFLANAAHMITTVSISVHILGIYTIFTKTPRTMSSVKWYFVNLHCWIFIYDHFLGFLSIPFLMLPTLSGFSLGILPKLGVPNVLIVALVLALLAYVLLSVLAIFENRFHIMCNFSWKVHWEKVRFIWLLFHYFVAIVIFIPFFYLVPEQTAAVKKVFETLPCLPDYIHKSPVFVLTDQYEYHLISLSALTITGFLEGCAFVWFLVRNVIEQVKTKKISKKTLQLQIKFCIALVIQITLPICLLVLPLAFSLYTNLYLYYDQAWMNILIVMETTHGILSTFVMILIHYPYRTAIFGRFSKFLSSSIEKRKRKVENISIVPTQVE